MVVGPSLDILRVVVGPGLVAAFDNHSFPFIPSRLYLLVFAMTSLSLSVDAGNP